MNGRSRAGHPSPLPGPAHIDRGPRAGAVRDSPRGCALRHPLLSSVDRGSFSTVSCPDPRGGGRCDQRARGASREAGSGSGQAARAGTGHHCCPEPGMHPKRRFGLGHTGSGWVTGSSTTVSGSERTTSCRWRSRATNLPDRHGRSAGRICSWDRAPTRPEPGFPDPAGDTAAGAAKQERPDALPTA